MWPIFSGTILGLNNDLALLCIDRPPVSGCMPVKDLDMNCLLRSHTTEFKVDVKSGLGQ